MVVCITMMIEMLMGMMLQLMSRNLIYFYVSIAALFSSFSVALYENKRKFLRLLPSFLLNSMVLHRCICLQLEYGNIVADYQIAITFMAILVLMSFVTMLPASKVSPSRKEGETFLEIKSKF